MNKRSLAILALVFVLLFLCITNVLAATGYDIGNIESYVGMKIIDTNYYHASEAYYPYKKRLDRDGNLQCVGYVYARLEEKLGLSPNFSSGAGAKDIPNNAPNGAVRFSNNGTKYTIDVYKNDGGEHIVPNCWVSFGSGSSKYGHVIYVEEVLGDTIYYTESGTKMWKNGTTGVLKKKQKSDFINNCSSGGVYVGTIVFRTDNQNIHNHAYKGADEHCIKCGEAYKPKVESMNNQKSNVIVAETSLKARPYQDSETISKVKRGTEVTLINSYINAYGNLWYEVRCNGKSGYMYNDKVGSASSLSINMTDWPSSIKVGSSYGLRGTIKSNYSITKVEGYVQNSSGSNVLTSVDNPNSTSLNVRNANLNTNLAFNKLGEGDYKLIIKAYDNSGKVVTASKNFNVYREQQKAASSLSINLERYPVSLNQGSSFGLRGSVDSNYNISEVSGYVTDSAGNTVLSSRDYPNSTSMNIRYADLNNSLVFNRLGAGDYTMKVVAYDSSGRQAVATKNFSVYGGSSNNNSGVASSLSINMTSYPSSINQGSGFGLRGSIDSNYNITKVSGYVLDSSGNVVLSSTDYPNSTSMNVIFANLNNDLVFNRLGSGNYTLKVVASDGVTSREWSSGFSVSGGQVSQGNVRTGIINIPSGWDNLSIRNGPGTGYQIVGSMNQGASCTVYTDKTQNGWYYVNYNGVTGYASGRQINLQ